MTIKGLHEFLREVGAMKSVSLAVLGRSTLPRKFIMAVDTSEFIYKYHYVSKKESVELSYLRFCNETGRWVGIEQQDIDYRLCTYFRHQINMLRKNNIEPLYVLDGPPRPEKGATKEKRHKDAMNKRQEVLRWETDPNAKHEYKKAVLAYNAPPKHYAPLLMGLFSCLGCGYYQAQHESDELLSQLKKSKIVDAVMSEDGDQIAYGTSFWVKEISKDKTEATVCSSDIAINKGGFVDQAQLRAFCIANGTDYNNNIPGHGPSANKNAIIGGKYPNVQALVNGNKNYQDLKWEDSERIFSAIIDIPHMNQPAVDSHEFIERWTSPEIVDKIQQLIQPLH